MLPRRYRRPPQPCDQQFCVETMGLEPTTPCVQSVGGEYAGILSWYLRRVELGFRLWRPAIYRGELGTKLGTSTAPFYELSWSRRDHGFGT